VNNGRTVLRIAVIIGMAQFGFATVLPLLPLHLTEHLGASVKLVGVVVATFALVETVFKTALGGVTDRVGRRPIIVAGLILSSLAPIIMAVLSRPVLFVPLRLLDGIGSAALWPAAAAAVADVTTPDRRATGMATLNLLFLAGLAAGPAFGLFVAGFAGSFRAGFYVASAVLAASAVMAALLFPRDEHVVHPHAFVGYHTTDPPARLQDLFNTFKVSPLLFTMYLVAFVQMFGIGLLVPIAAIFAKRVVGLSEHAIGALFLTVTLTVALATVPAGRMADRTGKTPLVGAGMVLGTIGMWIIPFSSGLYQLIGAGVLLGASYALTAPAWLALISELAPPGRLGLAVGASETVQGMGLVLGPLLGGLLWDTLGPRAPFIASAAVLTVGTVIALRALKHEPRRPPAPRP
jgi:DHA1 family multidrug resistance protein-like MFS transporter